MTLTIALKPEVETVLRQRALDAGCDVTGYIENLIEKDLKPAKTYDEILAPFRAEVAASGMNNDELDALFNDALLEVRAENRTRLQP